MFFEAKYTILTKFRKYAIIYMVINCEITPKHCSAKKEGDECYCRINELLI